MAMRARGGAAAAPNRGRVGGVRRVFEDFKPISEWQQDDESHTLIIHLPGFMKEQIKVSTEGRNTIRVRGERLVAGNKWSRFQEDFQVPENGEMNSIRAKFQGGSLNITVPKKEVKKTPEAAIIPPQPKLVDTPEQQPIPQKVQTDKVLPDVGTSSSQSKDEKNLQPEKTLQGRDGNLKQPTPQDERNSEHNKMSNKHNKHIATEKSDDVTKNKEGKKLEGIKELLGNQSAKKMELEKDRAPEKKLGEKESNAKQILHSSGDYIGSGMKKLKGLADLNEERQLLVNMGVAVFVIMALSAYVTFKFASGKDKN